MATRKLVYTLVEASSGLPSPIQNNSGVSSSQIEIEDRARRRPQVNST